MGGSSQQQAGSASNEADTGDAVMARWLQSAGLQHLAAPLAAAALDHRLLPSLLMQDYARYGVQSLEDKQKLFRLIKTISSGAEPISEPSTPPAYPRSANPSGMDSFLSPEFRGDFGAGILDLHSIDDSILFSEASISEPFSTASFIPSIDKGFENEFESSFQFPKQQTKPRFMAESSPVRSSTIEKERGAGRDNNVARIKVVVRKRPVNKKELGRKEEDIVTIADRTCSVTVHEPKLKVDLTAYVEKHEFFFDAVLDDHVSNDEVYNVTVEPIVPAIFQRTKATCFAYGQTGSGKTYTMQPLPLRASEDILSLMQQPSYKQEGFQLWLSFFEIYGGKLYDLLNDRRKLCMREDGRQQVCIVGLQEYRVSDVQLVREYIDKGNSSRSTGSTGANEESSRSHAILQLVVKKGAEGNDARAGRPAGKLSFIDLAGSERGADTTDNDRQTRMEGAEINKSLLALKECIRALDNDQGHIPFRGSKLTEVLRDSFMGDSRTVMISCISPNTGSCEHTLNTLRYADRVKSLSKGNNTRKDIPAVPTAAIQRETNTSPPPVPPSQSVQQLQPVPDYQQQVRVSEYQQQVRAPEYQQQGRAFEYQQQARAPDYQQQARAPEYQQQARAPEYQQQARAPEYQQQARAPEYQPQARAPEYQQQGRAPEYQQQGRVPEYQQQGRAPEYQQQVRASEYQQQARAPDYQQQARAPEYQQQVRAPEYQQQARAPDYQQTRASDYQQQIRATDRFLWNSHLAEREGPPDYGFPGRDESNRLTTVGSEKDRMSFRDNNIESGPGNHRELSSAPGGNSENQEQERHQLILPSRRKGQGPREEKLDRSLSMDRNSLMDRNSSLDRNFSMDRNLGQVKEEISKSDGINGIQRRQNPREEHNLSASQFTVKESDSELELLQTGYDGHINAILEEEEEVISAHRKEVEDTMEIVREEMKLLAEVDRPGSRIDRYVSQLNYVLSRKSAGIVNLQARLTRFQRHLKEQEILSRTTGRPT